MGRQIRRAAVLVWLMAMATLLGCGGDDKKVKITGKLLKNGQPLVVSRDFYVTVVFIPEAAAVSVQTLPARFKRATGVYDIELPPGNYRINYVIVEKGQEPWRVPAEQKAKSYDLTKDQELDIEIK